jgi:hypothetical protein
MHTDKEALGNFVKIYHNTALDLKMTEVGQHFLAFLPSKLRQYCLAIFSIRLNRFRDRNK